MERCSHVDLRLKKYELTMKDENGKEKLMDGLKIGENIILSKELSKNDLVVSFMALPAYITDDEILTKLMIWGVSAVSPIKRRVWPGTDIAEGTRFVKVRFPKEVVSLPYSTKFETLQGEEYFRVIHDRQVKVCRLCIQPGHIMVDCPEFICFKCRKQGHYARQCDNTREESDNFFSWPEEEEEEDEAEERAAPATPAETEEVSETPLAEREEVQAAAEETPKAERKEVESGGGHQHAPQREGEELLTSQLNTGAHRTTGDAAEIGSSMDGVVEEMDMSVEGKIKRVGGMGPPRGPAPPPKDHVSTSIDGSNGVESPRSSLGRVFGRPEVERGRARGGVKTRGGVSPRLAPGAGEEMNKRALAQEKQQEPPKDPEADILNSDEDMALSPEALNSLKRKAREERGRAHEKSAKK